MISNIDGWVLDGVIECKHVSGFAKDEEFVSHYYPQLQHYPSVTGAPRIFFSVIYGNHRWKFYEIDRDAPYIELSSRASYCYGGMWRKTSRLSMNRPNPRLLPWMTYAPMG